MKLLLTILSVICLGVCAYSACNVCNANMFIKCVSQTNFSFCNAPGNIYGCPAGHVCSARVGCTNDSLYPADCPGCSNCTGPELFVCTGVRSYSICDNTSIVASGLCNEGFVCTTTGATFCSAEATNAPTCSTPSVTTPTNPTQFCQNIRVNARFPSIGTNATCKTYIYCYINDKVWYGNEYECPGSTYFNPATKYCEVTSSTVCRT